MSTSSRIVERTVLFADLRGSTGLYETLGNAEASGVVTQTIRTIAQTVPHCGGQIIKTLGDGLLAVFAQPVSAVQSAVLMHDELERLVQHGRDAGASPALRLLKLQMGLARGEIVEMGGDCFGDAVNVAARLLDHAGDNEILVTSDVLRGLPAAVHQRFRSLDMVHLRGRAEPVKVHVLDGRRVGDQVQTQYGSVPSSSEPEAIRLSWHLNERVFDGAAMPLVLGRGSQSQFRVEDNRVSRAHARIDWHAGTFQITDLSFNGTYLRFGEGEEIIGLKRNRMALHGHGVIGLGGTPSDPAAPCVRFEVLSFSDTEPGRTH